MALYGTLQRATAALNTEQENMSRDEENRLQGAIATHTGSD
jgi:hypothetical protein